MVIVSLAGGLGNQLFQFAAGYSLAKAKCQMLVLDNAYATMTRHLPSAGLLECRLDSVLLRKNSVLISSPFISRTLRVGLKVLKSATLNERKFLAVRENLHVNNSTVAPLMYREFGDADNYWLNGYWQNRSYFIRYESEIADLIFSPRRISEIQTVAVHVRKGDISGTFMDICSPEYYRRGIEQIETLRQYTRKDFVVNVYSEDVEWVRKFVDLSGFNVNYIKGTPGSTAEDFLSMSSCDDIVISNSTYSYWAALKLSSKRCSVVVCPGRWRPDVSAADINLYPSHWRVLDEWLSRRP